MRLRTAGILAFWVGLFLFVWGVLALFSAIGGISGGGSGPHPIIDFARNHFLKGGPILALAGLVMWRIGRQNLKQERDRMQRAERHS